ncbi:Beta-ketoacyl synthase [Apiospora marii]|uniref:Beta-ketoacyl synthase n=1 Tax=Apiospora marii TaxID=335849 RepID=UPI00313129CC
MTYVEPIAIVGSSCRFPGESSSPSKLWKLLSQPRDVASKISRFAAEGFYHKDAHHHGSSNVLESYLLSEDTRRFDAQFFNIQAGEAGSIDPQQRLLIEVIYEALELAGLKMEELSGSPTGVYVGVMCHDFSQITHHDLDNIPKYAATGTALSILSNRISYFFNWKGPSMTIDTACSSSLVAVHQAVQLLRSGQSRHAVAAGSNLIFAPTNYIAESNVNMLSPTGRSRMWDAAADGYARGEGVACVVLKRLRDAIADGDHVECVIRETGVNQDGRTPGITMPSSESQAELIRQTYARAGLNPLLESDRCQYFEAHGTGTKAGDPQEASAIYQAFASGDRPAKANGQVLYVGSIKTVIGHTEGTAGLAGLLKASLSIQNATIPPNLLFNELNPAIDPYYGFLQIPTAPKRWPVLPPGVPRRASINSFGFGGTNAHAIIESYMPPTKQRDENATPDNVIPILLSASSEKALTVQLKTWLNFLENSPSDTSVQGLAWTLSRRSALSQRVCFEASTVRGLEQQLRAAVESKGDQNRGFRPSPKKTKTLGVFTGQGAQWPRMGWGLVQSSSAAATTLRHLDASLQSLSEQDRPSWSLWEELQKPIGESRVMEAEFSQPLCTAVQILLVDILYATGVSFEAVVGHSSGEIGAAYACGYLSATDAVRVAYLRGRVSRLAHADGAMMAAGTSTDDAEDLCSLPVFKGRLNVAATNSSASVTLSGDAGAIERAKLVLDDEGKLTRVLNVDKAWHSHHMGPCAEPYMQAMSRAGIQALVPENGPSCRWFSSVVGGAEVTPDFELYASYWMENLVQPVMFAQALESAIEATGAAASLSLVVEVGPHPALKAPAGSVIEEAIGARIPYTGMLSRGGNDVEALSAGIGAAWCNIVSAPSTLNLSKLSSLFSGSDNRPALLKSVPTYTWDHSHAYFTESRATRALLSRSAGQHELLGVRLDGGPNDFRWRNFIKQREMPWLRGHQIQGQVVFPGAGFASMAIEACKAVVGNEHVSLVEILDLRIHRAMVLPDEDSVGVEILVSLTRVVDDKQHGTFGCDYECTICPNDGSAPFTASTARIRLELYHGDRSSSPPFLPPRSRSSLDMSPVDIDLFYTTLANSGYNYSDMFQGIRSLERTTDTSAGVIHVKVPDDYDVSSLTLHPAPLDVAFQSIFGALGAPGDGRLWTTLVPTRVSRIQIDSRACGAGAGLGSDIAFDALVSVSASEGISGDVDMFNAAGGCLVQIEGLRLSPLVGPSPQDDRQVFSHMVWGPLEPDATRGFARWELKSANLSGEDAYFVERACFFYMRRLHETITPAERAACEWHSRKYLAWVADTVDEAAAGRHAVIRPEWVHDTWDTMKPMMSSIIQKQENFSIITTIGDRLIPWVRGKLDFLEIYRENNMLDHIYHRLFGFTEYNDCLGRLVGQLCQRFQQMDMLEIGAGTGSATEAVLRNVGDSYRSYTYTDISVGFFNKAEVNFKKHTDRFVYSKLDIEQDPAKQGYVPHSYDLVLASNVLHATKSLETTLRNVRGLLKPGGYLVFLEITDTDPIYPTFVFGTLKGWWVGEADGRPHHPLITQDTWAGLLRRTGFSGLDTATPPGGHFLAPQSVMLTQAMDAQMELIRQPTLLAGNPQPSLEDVLVVGGTSVATFQLRQDALAVLKPLARTIVCVERFGQLEDGHFTDKQLVLSLTELDEPVFHPFTSAKWKALQVLTEKACNVVWVTQGGLSGTQPYGHMMTGVARCLTAEKPAMKFQILDFDARDAADIQPTIVVEALLRMHISNAWASSVEPYTPTWTLEREVRIGLDADMTVPRYMASHELDARYNSSHRVIRDDLVPDDRLTVVDRQGAWEVERTATPDWDIANSPLLQDIQVERSTLMALTVGSVGALYLLIGKSKGASSPVIALSTANSSTASRATSWMHQCDAYAEGKDPSLLLQEAVHACWVDEILSTAPSHTAILVHEPPTRHFAAALEEAAAKRHVSIHFTTSIRDSGTSYVYIHPSTHDRALAPLLPENLVTFVVLSGDEDVGRVAARIESRLPIHCHVVNLSVLMAKKSYIRPHASPETVIPQIMDRISRYLLDTRHSGNLEAFEELHIAELAGSEITRPRKRRVAILNWTARSTIPVRLCPAEDIVKFRPDKTYWLIGLTGQLGISLCKWMAERGARHIAVTSRNPNINKAWLSRIEADGVQLHVMSCDVTDRRSVLETYEAIRTTMPPIAGVCNGAMVLNDGIIPHMTHEKFTETLRPKVDGTRFLNDIFDKPSLDFFIVFSSLAYITGNVGQSSYAAANAFMASMIQGRRARGLAGSVMNLAGIHGIGYIIRTDLGILKHLASLGYSNLSEWDFLQFFAEAVMAGKPGSKPSAHEISSSLRPYDAEQESNPPSWLPIPAFSYYKRTRRGDVGEGALQEVSVRAQLKKQTTKEGVWAVLQTGLCQTLCKMLGLRPEDNDVQPDTRLIDLGIDSLVAVDIRFWFSKELDLDMPVLKLLSGATVEEMVQDTAERLSPELTPHVKVEAGAAEVQGSNNRDSSSTEPRNDTTHGSGASSHALDTEPNTAPSSTTDANSDEKEDAKPVTMVSETNKHVELVFERKQSMGYPSLQFWFLLQQRELLSAFNCSFRIAFRGRLDVDRMARAARRLGERHDSLRTAFYDDAGNNYEPTQAVLASGTAPLRLETRSVTNLQEAIEFTDELQRHYVFDLGRGEVVRLVLLSENELAHYLVIGIHHIAIDGYSFFVFLRELVELYEGRHLEPVQTQWSTLVAEQKLAVDSGSMAKDVEFWRAQLTAPHGLPDPIPMLPFAKVQTRVPVTTFALEEPPMVALEPGLVQAIRARCRALKVTRFHFFMTVLRLMLFELAGVDELCVGMVDAGRGDTRSTNLVGLMVNTLPLRFRRTPSRSFAQLCREVRDMAYLAMAHARLPFKALLERLALPLSRNAAPIFQVTLDYLPQKAEPPAGLGAATDEVQSYLNYALTDIMLDVNDFSQSDIRLRWRAQTDFYSNDSVQMMMHMYIKLVKRFANSGPDCNVPIESLEGGLDLYDTVEIKDAVDMSLGAREPSTLSQTPSHIIQGISECKPDATALKDGSGAALTYSQMARRVRQIELALLESGVEHERVACYQQPTMDWVCSLLAVWKVGAAHVPLDSRLPASRIASLLELSSPSAILCDSQTLQATRDLAAKDVPVLDLSNLPQSINSETTTTNNSTNATVDGPALIIFTSGSTGTPKCVEIRHSSLANVIQSSLTRHCSASEPLVTLQQSAVSFDLCFGQVLMGLCSGGSVVVASARHRSDPKAICKLLLDERISLVIATPTELAHWFRYGRAELDAADSWRYALVGGEALPSTLKASFRQLNKAVALVNVYGPAEASVWCTTAELDYRNAGEEEGVAIPIGQAVPNCGVFVVDKNLRLVPSGVTGEIVVTGAGVANGYYGQGALTEVVFLADSLTPAGHFSQGQKRTNQLYRTGDSGRYGRDGKLYYEGRIEGDSQVKLNGIRIEIREVEWAILRASQGVLGNAVVSFRRNPDFLVGHVEFIKSDGEFNTPEEQSMFLDALIARLPLPKYMCPAMLVPLEKIPVNSHGKADRRAAQKLPIARLTHSQGGESHHTETEASLRDIWSQVLPSDLTQAVTIQPETDFFSLGGGSYLLVRVQRMIRERFHVSVPVRELFSTSSLRDMAALVDTAAAVAAIDWHVETALGDIARGATTRVAEAPDRRLGMKVVLTGATGYLGRNILKALNESPDVSTIYCIAVRDQARVMHFGDDGKPNAKIIVYSGNLGAPLLDLTTEVFNKLAMDADVLIHSGADRSFWDSYQTLRGVNFVSTKTMVQMAAPRRLPVHFISSGGLVPKDLASGDEEATEAKPVSVTSLSTPPADGSNGYLASKWASEAYLETAGRELGLPVYIHRVTGAGRSTKKEIADDLQAELRSIATKLKAVPHPSGWRGSFDVLRNI